MTSDGIQVQASAGQDVPQSQSGKPAGVTSGQCEKVAPTVRCNNGLTKDAKLAQPATLCSAPQNAAVTASCGPQAASTSATMPIVFTGSCSLLAPYPPMLPQSHMLLHSPHLHMRHFITPAGLDARAHRPTSSCVHGAAKMATTKV